MANIYGEEIGTTTGVVETNGTAPHILDIDLTQPQSNSQLFSFFRIAFADNPHRTIIINMVGGNKNSDATDWTDFVTYLNEKEAANFMIVLRGTVDMEYHYPLMNHYAASFHKDLKICFSHRANRIILKNITPASAQDYFKYYMSTLINYDSVLVPISELQNFGIYEPLTKMY